MGRVTKKIVQYINDMRKKTKQMGFVKDLKKEVDELKLFKTKAVTIFAVIQFGMAFALFFDKLF